MFLPAISSIVEGTVLRFPRRHPAHIGTVSEHNIAEFFRQDRQSLKMAGIHLSVCKTKTCDADSQVRKFDGLEFLLSEDVNIGGPGFFPVGGSLDAWVVVSRRDEYADTAEVFELLSKKFKCVGCDALQLKKIACDEHKIGVAGPGVLQDAAERAADCLSFSVPEPGRESGSGETGIQMNVRHVDKANESHRSRLQVLPDIPEYGFSSRENGRFLRPALSWNHLLRGR